MFKANQLFILSGVSDSVLCEHKQDGNKTVFTFYHTDDHSQSSPLIVTVNSSRLIHSAGETKIFNIAFTIGNIQQGKSDNITSAADVCGIITAIVNDVFPVDIG